MRPLSIPTLCICLLLATGLGGCKKETGGTPAKSGDGSGAANASGGGDSGSKSNSGEKPDLAFVTNGVAGFWTIAQAGADKAGADFDVEVTVIMPSGITDQTRKIEDLLTRGTDGIAISPINPENQGEVLNTAAAKSNLITHDSDAPDSDRLLYIGMDNYEAGFICGQLVRKALPDGGEVMVFIGRLDQDNAKRRAQGSIDAILGREPDASRKEDLSATLVSDDGKYTVLGVMTDQFDRAKAKANAEDVLTRFPGVDAMVGLFEYNPPLIMEALDRAGKLGQIKVIAFDENDTTLKGIQDGVVVGTVVQNPYMYGYRSIEVLNKLHKGETDVIPADKFINIPARVVLQEAADEPFHGAEVVGVDAFWSDLKAKLGKE